MQKKLYIQDSWKTCDELVNRREKYNRRKDGLLECAVANTTVYVKKLINIQGKINLLVLYFRSKLKGKISLGKIAEI